MSFGFKVINDAGTVQIDDTYANFAIVQTGSMSVVAGNTYTVSQGGATAPVIAWTSDGDTGVIMAHTLTSVSGSTWTFTLYAIGSGNMRYFVFDNPVAYGLNTSNKMGMRIQNAAGQGVFDTGYNFINVQTTNSITGANDTNNYNSQISLTAGRTYAATNQTAPFCLSVIAGPPVGQPPRITYGLYYWYWGISAYSGGYTMQRGVFGSTSISTAGGAPATPLGMTANYLIFDVTGI